MIVYNRQTGRFEISAGSRSRAPALPYVRERAEALSDGNRPWGDQQILSPAPPPLDLAHLVSFADIERMVVDWLNSPVSSFTWFIDGTTTLFTPSWADVFNPARLMRFLQQRGRMYLQRLLFMASRGFLGYDDIAQTANAFVELGTLLTLLLYYYLLCFMWSVLTGRPGWRRGNSF